MSDEHGNPVMTAARRILLFFILVAFSVILYFLLITLRLARGQSPDSSWVDQLQNQKRETCCFNSDGRRLDDPDWRTFNDHYQVLFTEGWVDVPPEAVVTGKNQDGIARVWSNKQPGEARVIRCFLRGSLS